MILGVQGSIHWCIFLPHGIRAMLRLTEIFSARIAGKCDVMLLPHIESRSDILESYSEVDRNISLKCIHRLSDPTPSGNPSLRRPNAYDDCGSLISNIREH